MTSSVLFARNGALRRLQVGALAAITVGTLVFNTAMLVVGALIDVGAGDWSATAFFGSLLMLQVATLVLGVLLLPPRARHDAEATERRLKLCLGLGLLEFCLLPLTLLVLVFGF